MGVIIVYSPFAKNWARALTVPFILTLLLCIFRLSTLHIEEFGDVPAGGFVVLPFFVVVYAAIFRAVKIVIFKIFTFIRSSFKKG